MKSGPDPDRSVHDMSVVLPVFNGSRYLAESITSVLSQEGADFELLVCDDASTDRSLDVIDEFESPRLRLIRQTVNAGLFATLNRLVEESSGRIVRLWAQDDVMLPGCLRTEVEFHRRHPEIAMSYCARQVIDDEGRPVGGIEPDETPEVVSPELAAQISFYHGSMPGNIATVAIKREVLDQIGPFRSDMRVSADFEMWVRISAEHPVGFIKSPLIKLRSHAGQFSREAGLGVQFIKEDHEIVQTLFSRLPIEIKEHARNYNRRHRLRMYFHYMVRCMFTGKMGAARTVWREIARFDNPWIVGIHWLLSANGRFLQPVPRYAH